MTTLEFCFKSVLRQRHELTSKIRNPMFTSSARNL